MAPMADKPDVSQGGNPKGLPEPNYTRAIPRTEIRLRLACAWPMLIGLKTLALIRQADDLLDPAVTVNISRAAVYRILLRSGMTAWSNAALDGHYRGLRRPLEDVAARGVQG